MYIVTLVELLGWLQYTTNDGTRLGQADSPTAVVVCGGLCVRLVSGVPLALPPVAPSGWRAPGSASALGPLASVLEPPAVHCPFPELGVPQPRPHPPHTCSTHLGQTWQGNKEPRGSGRAPDGNRAQTQEGTKREMRPRHHTQAHSLQTGPSVSSKHVGCVEPLRVQPLGEERWRMGAVPIWGRPDSRARRADGG